MTKHDTVTPMTKSGLVVVSSPYLDPLTDVLARRLSGPVSDPFASELVVVPNVGVRDWLQRELGTRLAGGGAGIVANVRFMFAQQFLDTVFEASGSSPIDDWRIDRLMWIVHRAIDDIGRTNVPGATKKPLTVARVVADLFDRYGVHRPSMLRYWRAGRAIDGVEPLQELPTHLTWQQQLYAQVASIVGQPGPADRLAELSEQVRNSGLSDAVPERVTLFGFVSVNRTMRAVIEAVSAARDVEVHLVHPSSNAVPGSPVDRDRLVARDVSAVQQSGNPLLMRWGRPALETRQVLAGRWTLAGDDAADESTCLSRLRRSIIDDRGLDLEPLDESDDRPGRGDGSIQVHACHGRVRQVEVLRDAICHLLQDDPTLTLSDISVQCPDLVAYAPIIAAIFGSSRTAASSMSPPLDVSIADRVLVGENPYHDAFWALLDLAHSRCGVGEMMTMMSASPIRRRFEIDEDVLSRASDWFESLSVKFGLDTEHRRKWHVPDSIDVGTWDVALDRLFMGLALPAEIPFEGPGGIVPFDDVSVTDAPDLARIAEFLTSVDRLVRRLEALHTIDEWATILSSVIEDFFDDSDTKDFECRGIVDAIDQLVDASDRAGMATSESFSFDEIAAILADLISSSGSRPRFRSGAITVTDLLPQQGVPYRVIALLGASEAMFTSGGAPGDDILGLRPCVGDPMPTAAGRLQLLNLVLAARDVLIITCDGADINNNKPVPLPVPIQELLEATNAILDENRDDDPHGTRAEGGIHVLTQHPRQAFSGRALRPGSFRADRPFTFDPVALEVYGRLSEPPTPILAEHRASTVGSSRRVLADQMRSVVSKPAEFFASTMLGIRLPSSDSSAGNDFIDFWPSRLEYARVGRELLEGILRAPMDARAAADTFVRHMGLAGQFPPGRLGDVASQQVTAEVLSIIDLLPEDARHFEEYRSIDLDDVPIPGAETYVTGAVGSVFGFDLIRASFTRFREDLLLAPWVDLALVTLVEPEPKWTVQLVARGKKDVGVAHTIRLVGAGAEQRHASARRVLTTVQTLMECMQLGRIPYLPRTSEAIHRNSLEASRDAYEKDAEYSAATQFLFGRVSWDDFVAEEARAEDPAGPSSRRAERFAQFVWSAFFETTGSTPPEDDE